MSRPDHLVSRQSRGPSGCPEDLPTPDPSHQALMRPLPRGSLRRVLSLLFHLLEHLDQVTKALPAVLRHQPLPSDTQWLHSPMGPTVGAGTCGLLSPREALFSRVRDAPWPISFMSSVCSLLWRECSFLEFYSSRSPAWNPSLCAESSSMNASGWSVPGQEGALGARGPFLWGHSQASPA